MHSVVWEPPLMMYSAYEYTEISVDNCEHITMTSRNIVPLHKNTSLPIDPNKVLDNAPRNLESCIIIGSNPDGTLYVASSETDAAKVLWDLESAKRDLFALVNGE